MLFVLNLKSNNPLNPLWKMHIKSKLIEKQIISKNSYNELFDYLDFPNSEKKAGYQELLKTMITGRYSNGYTRLHTANFGKDKCWFINSGMVIGLQIQKHKQIVILIFKAGEIAILPNTFFYNDLPHCTLVACPETHLLEISYPTILKINAHFPETISVTGKMACASYNNFIEKSMLSSLPGKEAILEFHNRYPEVKGPDRKIKLLDIYQASYLGINNTTFSKLLKKVYWPATQVRTLTCIPQPFLDGVGRNSLGGTK